MPTPQPWQTTVDPRLIQRLLRPVTQPGVIGSALGNRLQARADRWANRLPLLTLAQRHRSAEGAPPGQTPIVYAQPQPPEVNSDGLAPAGLPKTAPVAAKPTVIQAKFAPGAAANLSLAPAPASPAPSLLPQVQSWATAAPSQPDPALNELGMPWPKPLVQPELSVPGLPVAGLPVAGLPVVEGRSPAISQATDAAIAPPPISPLPAPPLPVVTVQPWDRPLEAVGENSILPHPLAALGQPGQWPEPLSAQQRLSQGAVSFAGQIPEPLQPEAAPELRPVEPAPAPAPLPRVRNVPPRHAWGQANPLVFNQLGTLPPAHSSALGPAAAAHRVGRESSPGSGIPLASFQGGGATGATAQFSPPSIVRDIRADVPNAAVSSPAQATQATQAVFSAAPAATPPLDIDALAAQVERRLARRLAIERERRGWRP